MSTNTSESTKKRSSSCITGAAAATTDKDGHGLKKAKIDLMGLLDENLLRLVIRFAGDKPKTLARLCQVNKSFSGAMKDALSFQETPTTPPKGVIVDILRSNGHLEFPMWEHPDPNFVTLNLQSLAFYRDVLSEGLLEKKTVSTHDKDIPKLVSRILRMQHLMEKFPLVKADYEREWAAKRNSNIFSSIVTYMVETGILPWLGSLDVNAHIQINMRDKRKYTRHPIYNEYRDNVPANLFQVHVSASACSEWLNNLPLHLLLLIIRGVSDWKW